MQVRATQGDTVDLICQRIFGRTAGITESVLATNPGLADLGASIPAGTLITLPEPAQAAQPTVQLVQLWT